MDTFNTEYEDVEQLLSAAGIRFTVVERCPHRACRLCANKGLPVAA